MGGRGGERSKMDFTVPIEWLIACLLFVTGTYTIDMISGHRREGKIYDLIKVMMAKKLGEETK